MILVFGALAGTAASIWLGFAFVILLHDDSLDRLLIPWDQLAMLVVNPIVVGSVVAIVLARPAAWTKPLEAVR